MSTKSNSTPQIDLEPTTLTHKLPGEIVNRLRQENGFVPNLYVFMGKNVDALVDFMQLKSRTSSLLPSEREIVSLVTAQISGCQYCQSAHTVSAILLGFTRDQVMKIRKGNVCWDDKYEALTDFVVEMTLLRGRVTPETSRRFFAVGYTEENLIDIAMEIGKELILNYLYHLSQVPNDFPLVRAI